MQSAGKMTNHLISVGVGAPSAARRIVAAMLGEHPRLDDILLATSELVTNVVRHAGAVDHAELSLRRSEGAVRISVRQPGQPFDRTQYLSTDPHGRGLAIVEAITDRWGVEHDGDLMVWFEVADAVG